MPYSLRKPHFLLAATAAIVIIGGIAIGGVLIHRSGHAATDNAADINGDGSVNILDLSSLLSKWGTSEPAADLNHDGKVNIFDVSSLLSNWGTKVVTTDLTDVHKKDIAMQLVASAENSTLDWRTAYAYIKDIGDGRGYTGGVIGFTSGTHDMLELVQYYTTLNSSNVLAKYIPALQKVDGTNSHDGLGAAFENDWKTAATDPRFQEAQDHERDRGYFTPAVTQAKADGLQALGQFIYYDAIVMHGPGDQPVSFGGIRATAMKTAKTPAQGGDETAYLNAFLDARKAAMLTEAAHDDTSRVDTEQRIFLQKGNLTLSPPLTWKTYGDSYTISK